MCIRDSRCVGELIADPEQPMIAGVEQSVFTGFENHSGLTGLGAGARPLGLVRAGVGNGDGSRTEGATCGQVVGTYMHGPVLARNPALADALLSMATGTLPRELDDTEEEEMCIRDRCQRGRREPERLGRRCSSIWTAPCFAARAVRS